VDYVTELITEAVRLTQGKATLIGIIVATVMLIFFDRAPPVLRATAYAVITFSVIWFCWITLRIHWYGVPKEEIAAQVEKAPENKPEEYGIFDIRRYIGGSKTGN
jgi:ABC-type nickel/cobalt efflux system permease component RcnA